MGSFPPASEGILLVQDLIAWMQVSLSLCSQDGMHLVVFVPQLVCVILPSQPMPASCQLAQPGTRTDEHCRTGKSSVCYNCWQPCPLVHTEFLLQPALHCPCLAPAPAGMCLPAKRNPVGMQSWQTAVGTGSALCAHDGDLWDPAPHRENLSPGAAEQPGLVGSYLLSAQNMHSAGYWYRAELAQPW